MAYLNSKDLSRASAMRLSRMRHPARGVTKRIVIQGTSRSVGVTERNANLPDQFDRSMTSLRSYDLKSTAENVGRHEHNERAKQRTYDG